MVWGLLTGWLWAKPSVKHLLDEVQRLQNECEGKDEEIARLRQELREKREMRR